jgi:hypothetical protein
MKILSTLFLAMIVSVGAAHAEVYRFDFQPASGLSENGFQTLDNTVGYSAELGYGFVGQKPRYAYDQKNKIFKIFGRTITLQEAIPRSVLSNTTRDSVADSKPYTFRADVVPGDYDVTVWLGDVGKGTYQVQATVNGQTIDVERMDINIVRGNLALPTDIANPVKAAIKFFGNAVPRTVRVSAPDGIISLKIGPGAFTGETTWQYEVDQCADPKGNGTYEKLIVPAYDVASLQGLTIRPAVDAPIVGQDGQIELLNAPADAALDNVISLFNAGDLTGAQEAAKGLSDETMPVAKAAALLWIAGHPALHDVEGELLAEAGALLKAVIPADINAWTAQDAANAHLMLQVSMANDAEFYRRALGYGNPASSENMGRSNSLTEQWAADHPYYLKGRILWFRNRCGLDPRRCSVSWERGQLFAQQMDAQWGAVNPYVHLYATDEWKNEGAPWTVIDWGELAGDGPKWARVLMRAFNATLDLSEWWIVNRQITDPVNPYNETVGSIGGGWSDDVELVGLFGIMGYVLNDVSDISLDGAINLVDGVWESGIIDTEKGFEAAYADVEHSAEPTGESLHLYPMIRYGDPQGIERILKNAKLARDLFLKETDDGLTLFKGNHMSATKIATNLHHSVDIPLNGRAIAPLPWALWYSSNTGIDSLLQDWISSWITVAMGTEGGKPVGVFPNGIIATSVMGTSLKEGSTNVPGASWYGSNSNLGVYHEFPKYQHYLYNLAGLYYLRTGDAFYKQPFDAVVDYGLQYKAAGGHNPLGDAPGDNPALWAGGKLGPTTVNKVAALAQVGKVDNPSWNQFIDHYGKNYSTFLQNPTDPSAIYDLTKITDKMVDFWPYRTTEGVMTDRIVPVGVASEVSFFLGADHLAVYYGMPVQAVTWSGTSRLFAAAVTKTTSDQFEASTYLFTDAPRTVSMNLWALEVGGTYRLEAGPAVDMGDETQGLGQAPASIAETKEFVLHHRGDSVSFELPGRQVYAVRITQLKPGSAAPPLAADLAIAPRDVTYNAQTQTVDVIVHNIGSADAPPVTAVLYKGDVEDGDVLGTLTVPAIAAPNDLIAKTTVISFDAPSITGPTTVSVVIDSETLVDEITEVNNRTTGLVAGTAAALPAPMVTALTPQDAAPGDTILMTGKNFQTGLSIMASESPTSILSVVSITADTVTLKIAASAPESTLLVSVVNPDGKKSNLLPLYVACDGPCVPVIPDPVLIPVPGPVTKVPASSGSGCQFGGRNGQPFTWVVLTGVGLLGLAASKR